MPYQEDRYQSMTIWDAARRINKNLFLPVIQRKFVWSDRQIVRLMDSILRGYPIGTFLFWRVKSAELRQEGYPVYGFIQNFHERDNSQNSRTADADLMRDADVWIVLDGQQRLAAMYLALYGSICRKEKKKWRKNDRAFVERELYFDLRSAQWEPSEEDEDDTDGENAADRRFRFFSEGEVKAQPDGAQWRKVKDIVNVTSLELEDAKKTWGQDPVAEQNIESLWKRFHEDAVISYFEVKEKRKGEVLDIFVRINSGGTVLSRGDLLFSTIVAYWEKGREKIDKLLKEVNRANGAEDGFKFSSDLIIRSCLYVLDMPVALKVGNLTLDRVKRIEENWDRIEEAVRDTVGMLREMGFCGKNILSYNAVCPMIYVLYRAGGRLDKNSRAELKRYFVIAQVKGIFGASTNTALSAIREALKKCPEKRFSMESLRDVRISGDQKLTCTEEELDQMMEYTIGPKTYLLLTLLYPEAKYGSIEFHQDHMHPRAAFEEDRLKEAQQQGGFSLSEEQQRRWREMRDTLPNLQMLAGRENESKQDRPLKEWVTIEENQVNAKYVKGVSWELADFEQFMEKRREQMKAELRRLFF